MKKIAAVVLSFLAVFAFAACAGGGTPDNNEPTTYSVTFDTKFSTVTVDSGEILDKNLYCGVYDTQFETVYIRGWKNAGGSAFDFSLPITADTALTADKVTVYTETQDTSGALQNCYTFSSVLSADSTVTTAVMPVKDSRGNTVRKLYGVRVKSTVLGVSHDYCEPIFDGAAYINTVIVSDGIRTMGELPDPLNDDNQAVFKNCAALQDIYLPSSLTAVSGLPCGDATFEGCDIKNIYVPDEATATKVKAMFTSQELKDAVSVKAAPKV